MGPKPTDASKTSGETAYFVGSPARMEELVLQGIDPIALNGTPAELSHTLNEISDRSSPATDEFVTATFEQVERYLGLNPQLVTGQNALEHALSVDPSLRNIPLINLAPNCFHAAEAAKSLLDQMVQPPYRYRENTAWNAEVVEVHISRAVFYGMTPRPQWDRAGIAGKDRYATQYWDQAAATTFGKANKEILLVDDRSSGDYSTLRDAANGIKKRAAKMLIPDLKVRAYVVGHSGGMRFQEDGSPATCPDGVPVYSPVFRYETPEQKREYEAKGIPAPAAEELLDLCFFEGSGDAIVQGWAENADKIIATHTALHSQIKSHRADGSTLEEAFSDIKEMLLEFGVKILDDVRLRAFVASKLESDPNTPALTTPEFKRLFITKIDDRTLEISGFDPYLVEHRRIPLIWPGHRQDKSFWRRFPEDSVDYLAFSRAQMYNTIAYLEKLESIVGVNITARALPFLLLREYKYMASEQSRRTNRAVDYLNDLVRVVTEAIDQYKTT